jgi:hypothetical protein
MSSASWLPLVEEFWEAEAGAGPNLRRGHRHTLGGSSSWSDRRRDGQARTREPVGRR